MTWHWLHIRQANCRYQEVIFYSSTCFKILLNHCILKNTRGQQIERKTEEIFIFTFSVKGIFFPSFFSLQHSFYKSSYFLFLIIILGDACWKSSSVSLLYTCSVFWWYCLYHQNTFCNFLSYIVLSEFIQNFFTDRMKCSKATNKWYCSIPPSSTPWCILRAAHLRLPSSWCIYRCSLFHPPLKFTNPLPLSFHCLQILRVLDFEWSLLFQLGIWWLVGHCILFVP